LAVSGALDGRNYSDNAAARDRRLADAIPDLSGGTDRLADILAAMEWQVSVFDAFNEQGYGSMVLADVSSTASEDWASDPYRSVARGVLALNRLTPTWILQQAGQNAHTWPGFREQPVSTRHVDRQFSWLKPVSLHPTWLIYYLANSGLEIGTELQAAMVDAVVRASGREALEIEREGDNVALVVPRPGQFFLVAEDAFASFTDVPGS
jgi:hypothetical protein